jgi:hypothetical protein
MSLIGVLGGLVMAYGGPIAVTAIVAQGIDRAISDHKRGFLGFIRKVAKVVGLYANPGQTAINHQVELNTEELAHQHGGPVMNPDARTPNGFGRPPGMNQ